MFERLKKNSEAGEHARGSRRGRSVLVALLLVLVVLLSAGSGLYAGASFFAQQAPGVTVTTTILTTTTSWTTSIIWSTIWTTVEDILTTMEYTTSTSTVTISASDTYTKMLLHMDGTDGSQIFTDSSLGGHSITARGNAQIDTAQSKFGGASGLFDGSGDYLSIPDSADWAFGSGDFTIDFWVRRNLIGGRQFMIGQAASSGADASISFMIEFQADNTVAAYFGYGGTFVSFASTRTITDTTSWHHIAYIRNGNNLYLYVDGTRDGAYATSATMTDSSAGLGVGRPGDYVGLYLNGWVDELRISKGIARWTSNFTPPTAPY